MYNVCDESPPGPEHGSAALTPPARPRPRTPHPSPPDLPTATTPVGPIYVPARTTSTDTKININLHGLEPLFATFSGMQITPFKCVFATEMDDDKASIVARRGRWLGEGVHVGEAEGRER